MDELSSRVRELAPDADVTPEDVASARLALHEAIVAERPGAVRALRSRTPRSRAQRTYRMPGGLVAAVAAVLVVAVIAAGAVVASQWLSRPPDRVADDWARGIDLSRPLLDQLAPGQYLRVATTTDAPSRHEADGQTFSDNSYVVLRAVSATYLSADATWISVFGEVPPTVVETAGPDGEAMALLVEVDEPPFISKASTPEAGWADGLPDDAIGIIGAFAERAGSGPPESAAQAEQMFWFMALQDPAWFVLTTDQRRVVLDFLEGRDDTVRTTGADGSIELAWDTSLMDVSAVLDASSLLIRSGAMGRNALSSAGSENWSTWTTQISIVDAAPEVVIPDDPATSSCNGTPIPGSVFYYDDLTEMLDDDSRAAVAGEGVPELAADEWYAVSQSSDRVVLWSWVLHGQQLTDGPVPTGHAGVTHELMTIERVGGAWQLTGWETCVLKQELPDHEVADVELDPAFPLTAASRQLRVLVTPVGCSAQPAEVLELQEFDEAVEILIGIPRNDDAVDGCADPVTQELTIELTAPLGDRAIRDLTYMEERMLRAAP